MKEEREFEVFVKRALEEGAGLAPERLLAIERIAKHEAMARRRSRSAARWGVPLLAAASLTLAAAFSVAFDRAERSSSSAHEVRNAIGLLLELDGIDNETIGASTTGELLMVWQDAPCADLLN